MSEQQALQDVWLEATCYGCGPNNPHGLQIKSFWSDDGKYVIATFDPKPYHTSGFDNVMYGGLVASLIDCHSNWSAIASTYRAENREHGSLPAISYVTGTLNVKYLKPTPLDQTTHLRSWVEGEVGRKTRVVCELGTATDVTAVGDSIFVRVNLDKSRTT